MSRDSSVSETSPIAAVWQSAVGDLLPSVVVFLVALPLCMGIAIASGVPPALGLVTGIVGGLVVGWIAGSPLQVSGPAAGLAVIVWQIVETYGIAVMGAAVFLAGAIQLAAGLLRLGQWFRAVSPAVIRGMLAGIGALIFASQFHVMVDDKPRGSGIDNLLSVPEALFRGIFPLDGTTHHLAAAIGLLTIVTIVLWAEFRPRRFSSVPPPLLAVVVASGTAALLGLDIRYVQVPAQLSDGFTWVSWEALASIPPSTLLLEAAALAFIASAETLLCATAVDLMHTGPRTNYDRELAAQGVGNLLCGAVGALPMTGVIVRSTANVGAGAKTRASAILHGAWILLLVVAFPGILEVIPTSCLAAILVYTGYKLMDFKAVRELRKYGRSEVTIYAATVVTIVTVDLLSGVLLGLGLSVAKLVYIFSHLKISLEAGSKQGVHHLHLGGAATFLALPILARALEALPLESEVHVHFDDLDLIDHACIQLLSAHERTHREMGGKFIVEWDELLTRHRTLSGQSAAAA